MGLEYDKRQAHESYTKPKAQLASSGSLIVIVSSISDPLKGASLTLCGHLAINVQKTSFLKVQKKNIEITAGVSRFAQLTIYSIVKHNTFVGRYSFRWQCPKPVHNHAIHTTCFLCGRVPYSLLTLLQSLTDMNNCRNDCRRFSVESALDPAPQVVAQTDSFAEHPNGYENFTIITLKVYIYTVISTEFYIYIQSTRLFLLSRNASKFHNLNLTLMSITNWAEQGIFWLANRAKQTSLGSVASREKRLLPQVLGSLRCLAYSGARLRCSANSARLSCFGSSSTLW